MAGGHDHADLQERDQEKAADAERRGFRVLRLRNEEVAYTEYRIERVRACLWPPPLPSQGGAVKR
jgi:very-short-patch-repair endonuclease